ncbi:MAG TPA: NAD-dependent epimerase/dehydratase family protein [Burkholderiales bacterium]|nr:NAD-dependent epimerase/dehydratase family protein [Burkholderiales bacterium]
MVVGDGMMAAAFASFAARRDVLVFASGVSDSTETREAPFARERALLARTRAAHPEALLLYFGTCSVDDPDRRDTPYVRHKLAMEALLAAAPGPWMVLRLPLAIGPGHRGNTLAKYLHEHIVRGEPFDIWSRSTRYPIDVADVVRVAERLVADRANWRRTINVALRRFAVLDFVRALESMTGKKARYHLVDKGAGYEVRCPEVERLAPELGLDYSDAYLERILRKYFNAQ